MKVHVLFLAIILGSLTGNALADRIANGSGPDDLSIQTTPVNEVLKWPNPRGFKPHVPQWRNYICFYMDSYGIIIPIELESVRSNCPSLPNRDYARVNDAYRKYAAQISRVLEDVRGMYARERMSCPPTDRSCR